jgi:hypothetical protein
MATAKAEAHVVQPVAALTPREAWRLVRELKISIEYREESDRWIAVFRNRASNIFLPVIGETPFQAVKELLSELGAEVAHG